MVCDIRPLKEEINRIRMTIGGDKLPYEFDTASPATDLIETKLIINSVISEFDKGARFCSIDLKDFFLHTLLPPGEREYMRIHYKYFDDELKKLYNIDEVVADDNYVYCEIKKGMYGLKQAAILAYKQLKEILEKEGYYTLPSSNGMWRHKTRRTMFALCVDDFGVKYFNNNDLQHLITTLQQHYTILIDKEGKHYCGLTLEWNYSKGFVDISMPGYVPKALLKFNHKLLNKRQYAPHTYYKPIFGKTIQYAPKTDDSPVLPTKGIRNVQSIVGTFLYYARAVDNTLHVTLNDLGTVQSKPTKTTTYKTDMLLDYLATNPNAKLRFFAGNMILRADSDAAYLILPGAKSCYAGYFYLESKNNPLNYNKTPFNAPVLVESKIIKHVVCSAAEAECAGLFYNGQTIVHLRNILEEMGHKQPPTKMRTDNKSAHSFVHGTMKLRRSKTWDKNWHWLRQEITHQILDIFWDKGSNNDADYFTKHHPPHHHVSQRPRYILKGHNMVAV